MRRIGLVVALAAVALLGACASQSDDPVGRPVGSDERPASGDRPAGGGGGEEVSWDGPDFTVETFDGERFQLSAQAGTPVVINFWESW